MTLIDRYSKVFAYLTEQFSENAARAQLDYQTFRTQLIQLIGEQDLLCQQDGYVHEYCANAKFAIVVFLDEFIQKSSWAGRATWVEELLQREIFSTTNGGVEFFEHLHKLNPYNPSERDVREIYYYCLVLGFEGKYYNNDQKALHELIEHNFELLADGKLDGRLFNEAYSTESTDQTIPKVKTNWKPLWLAAPFIGVSVLYFVLRLDVVNATQTLVASL